MKTRARVAVVQAIGSHRARLVSQPSLSAVNEKPYILLSLKFPAEDAQVPDVANRGLSETTVFVE